MVKSKESVTGKSVSITGFKLPEYDNLGLNKTEKREWREALEVGEQASTLMVVCVLDCVKCTMKVSSSFTTLQFHSHDARVRLGMLQKKASMELAAGEWGLERLAYYSELREQRNDPNQIGMDFPNQDDDEG